MNFHWTSFNYWNAFHILRVPLDNYLQLFSSKLMSGNPRVIYHFMSLVALGGNLDRQRGVYHPGHHVTVSLLLCSEVVFPV